MASSRTIRVALLLCDTPLPEVQAEYGNYLDIYRAFLEASLSTLPPSGSGEVRDDVTLVLDGFDVIDKGEYPERRLLEGTVADGEKAYDAVMLTGSKHTAHDDSLPWLGPLIDFVRTIGTDPALQHLKLIGVCFGMQIIARAMGGTCVPNPAGWEIGVYDVELAEAGRAWIGQTGAKVVQSEGDAERVVKTGGDETTADDVDSDGRKIMRIQQMHRDHVPAVPPSFALIGSSPKCPVQGFLQYYPSDPSSDSTLLKSQHIHILGVQGHPEFLPRIVELMVDKRSAGGVFNAEVTGEARRRLGASGGGDGRGVIGWGIWRVLLGEA